ncbi:Lipase, secreted [Metarhizium album ARSEF 1941]|uniref:Lipase, secreted n=1 Tax=Metarhizium album (strain ARSEF 1941) TaxID=1081103 RepID=A0A0B2WLE6_METAS|nr:Lipase, secreted [Metarhizium album ARSEF 1941]KHN93840.1 Lipase, secreted [Metarhizium album ARSEF 1941]
MALTLVWQLALWLTVLGCTVSAKPVAGAVLDRRAAPALPSRDAFYRVPDDLDSHAPGAILRHRSPPSPMAALGSRVVHLHASHQLLYRTTDGLDKATATVLTVLVPRNANYSKVLSYQVAEDSASINCAPSYAFQLGHDPGPGDGTKATQGELFLVEAALEQGWVVIVPDHLGPGGAFLANVLSGRATLDGIRAASNSGALTGISTKPTVTMWGYSGGSLATMFAAELQPSYAPEVEVAGAAVGGIVPSIMTVLRQVNGTASAGLIPPGMLGLAHQYPRVDALLRRHVLPGRREYFYKAARQCLTANLDAYANQDISRVFDEPDSVLGDPAVAAIMDDNDPGRRAPRIPMFVYKAVRDEVSPVAETDALVRGYCGAGASIEYLRDESANHGTLAVVAAPEALSWLRGRMDGQGRPTSCSTRTVFSALLEPGALALVPKVLLDAILDLLGKRVGPFTRG